MVRRKICVYLNSKATKHKRNSLKLQALLWSVWTSAVSAAAYVQWHSDHTARRALNLVALSVHCGVVGIIGLVVVTLIEMNIELWRLIE